MEAEVQIAHESILDTFQEEFYVNQIYPRADVGEDPYKRQLTKKEKKEVLEFFLVQYFNSFFSKQKKENAFLFFTTLKAVSDNGELSVQIDNELRDPLENPIKISFTGVDSNLISNFIAQFSHAYNVGLLNDKNIFT